MALLESVGGYIVSKVSFLTGFVSSHLDLGLIASLYVLALGYESYLFLETTLNFSSFSSFTGLGDALTSSLGSFISFLVSGYSVKSNTWSCDSIVISPSF